MSIYDKRELIDEDEGEEQLLSTGGRGGSRQEPLGGGSPRAPPSASFKRIQNEEEEVRRINARARSKGDERQSRHASSIEDDLDEGDQEGY